MPLSAFYNSLFHIFYVYIDEIADIMNKKFKHLRGRGCKEK